MVDVLVAEPNCLLRLGFRSVLANDAAVAIAAEAVDEPQLQHAFETIPHDVVLVSIALLQNIGLQALNRMRLARPASRLLVHSYDTDVALAVEALRFGASGFLSNESAPSELGVAISAVAKGKAYIAASMGTALAAHMCFRALNVEQAALTGIDAKVARMLAIGVDTRGIAAQLNLAPQRIAGCRARILKKMVRPGMNELLRCAIAKSL